MPDRAITAMQDVPGVPVRIADHLTELIVRGELAPGERIPEARITASLGVSRGSVREALHILARRNLVELAPRRGAFVTQLTEDDVRDLYELLIALFTSLGQLAVARWREDADLAPLRDLAGQIRACSGRDDALSLVQLSADLTDAICALVGNGYLTRALRDLRPVFHRSYYRVLASDSLEFARIADIVTELVDLIGQRDEQAIARAVRHYSERQRDQVLQTF